MSLNYNPQGIGQPQPSCNATKITSWLSPEQEAFLRKNSSDINLTISEEDRVRANCNHVDRNGNMATVPTNDGRCMCTICGSKFNMNGVSNQDLANAVNIVSDALEVSKLSYGNCPESARDFFTMIPLLKKVPLLYTVAINNLDKLASANSFDISNAYSNSAMSPAMYSAMTGIGYPQPQVFGAPQPGFGYYQPQPQANPMYGQVANAPMQPYQQPQQQGYYQPQPQANPMYGQVANAPMQPYQQPQQQGQVIASASAIGPQDTKQPEAQQPVKVNTAFKK